ncbi:hypothetical protein BJ322DRAFT_1023203 [Thelephora terrestris]|uniref:Uncharacterized protein n=1 Tax=Thelephora terrestris TaxID=56493 RepID=A0A9P6H7E7_9AGAM|nr:hypothetical protein BJ322DRAFT_1023203 [Thelephora terrestris]
MLRKKPKTNVKTFRAARRGAAKSHRGGQGYEPLDFDGEQRKVNKGWAERSVRCRDEGTKILSDGAKIAIRQSIQAGVFSDRESALEPPFMAPSTDPDLYSKWCSVCGDFGHNLVLCAGCKMGVCTTTAETHTGCFSWDPKIERSDFVFYCPYCAKASHKACELKLRRTMSDKRDVFLRYDPPVLIVATTWHETKIPYGRMLRDALLRMYVGEEESPLIGCQKVMLMEVALDSSAKQAADDNDDDGNTVKTQTPEAAEEFLAEHPTAKIVVVIDTHCLENGFFVWRGTGSDMLACTLYEILSDCIPSGVFQFISDKEGTPPHTHKSLIMNLSCGATISQPSSRAQILKGHCADAVFSLANIVTLVGEVAADLTRFVALWVQTPSGYDFLISRAFDGRWCNDHRPVISRKVDGHIAYDMFSLERPGGQVVLCHRNCGQLLKYRPKGSKVRFSCPGCGSSTTTPKITSDRATCLGRRDIVKAPFPPKQFPTEWKLGTPNEGTDGRAPEIARSRSLPIPSISILPTPTFQPPTRTLTPLPTSRPVLSASTSMPSPRLIIKVPARPRVTSSNSPTPTPPPLSPNEPSSSTSDLRKRSPAGETGTMTLRKRAKRD